MEEKRKIGIDIDDVVVVSLKRYLKFFNLKLGKNLEFEDIVKYHVWDLTDSVSKEECLSMVIEVHNSENENNVEMVKGAKEAIWNLAKNYKIFFITSRPPSVKEHTSTLFKKIFLNLDFEIIFSGEIHGGKTKSEICLENEINVIIEDNAGYALDCAKKGIKSFLLEKPWNQQYEKHENLIKVKNWDNILNQLK